MRERGEDPFQRGRAELGRDGVEQRHRERIVVLGEDVVSCLRQSIPPGRASAVARFPALAQCLDPTLALQLHELLPDRLAGHPEPVGELRDG